MSLLHAIIRVLRKIAVNSIIESRLFPRPWRPLAFRLVGVGCGKSLIFSGIFVDGRDVTNVRIGNGAMLNNQIYLDASGAVTIGDGVGLGSRVNILTATHEIGPREQRMGDLFARPVTIGNGVWIGAAVTIMPGVTIGDGSVIGAGSLVTKDCEPDAIYVGRPARLLRRLDPHSGEAAPGGQQGEGR